jgi:hypothetical protein
MKFGCAAILLAMTLSATSLRAVETAPAVSNMGNVKGGDVKDASAIIESKCTQCHSGKRIDAAFSANKDMLKIQREMERKGAQLNAREREVLGIYWKQQNPLKQ